MNNISTDIQKIGTYGFGMAAFAAVISFTTKLVLDLGASKSSELNHN